MAAILLVVVSRIETELAERARPARVAPYELEDVHLALRGDAVMLSGHLAPALHEHVSQVREALQTDANIEIWQGACRPHQVQGVLMHPIREPIVAELRGPILSETDPLECRALVGTIFGHGLVHAPGTTVGNLYHDARARAGLTTHDRFEIAAGVTADRYALVAARDRDAVIRLRVMLATGLGVRSLAADVHSMLIDWTTRVEGLLAADRAADPAADALAVRVWAIARFAESDLYRSLSGLGPGTERFDELEDELCTLLRDDGSSTRDVVPDEAEAEPHAGVSMREKLTRAGAAVVGVAGHAAPSLRRASRAIAGGVSRLVEARRRSADDRRPEGDAALDEVLHDDEEEDLLARFAELERRTRSPGDPDPEGER